MQNPRAAVNAVLGFLERRETFRADYQTFAGKVSAYELGPLHLLAYQWLLRSSKSTLPRFTRMSKAERVALKGAADEAGLGLTYSIGMTADMDQIPALQTVPHKLCGHRLNHPYK